MDHLAPETTLMDRPESETDWTAPDFPVALPPTMIASSVLERLTPWKRPQNIQYYANETKHPHTCMLVPWRYRGVEDELLSCFEWS